MRPIPDWIYLKKILFNYTTQKATILYLILERFCMLEFSRVSKGLYTFLTISVFEELCIIFLVFSL